MKSTGETDGNFVSAKSSRFTMKLFIRNEASGLRSTR